MDLIKITKLSKELDISSRSLRYYEEVGLIKSIRIKYEKYRYYDTDTVERLKQILILRKMQISIKDIIKIYESKDMSIVVKVFVDKLNNIDEELDSLYKIRVIVDDFLQTLINNGIENVSVIPVLYNKVNERLNFNINNNVKKYDYNHISQLKIKKPFDVHIVELPTMRVLSSFTKASNSQVSDMDGFWEFTHNNNLINWNYGAHKSFEFQNSNITGDYQGVAIIYIDNSYINNSPFVDYIFEGGLFAMRAAYVDDDIGSCHDELVEYLDGNSYYQIDYTPDGKQRHESLGEIVISPDESRERMNIYIPIKRKMIDVSSFKPIKLKKNISTNQIENSNPIGDVERIDLSSLVPTGYPYYSMFDNQLIMQSYIDRYKLTTTKKFKIPFRVDVIVKTDNTDIRLHYNKGSIILNWWQDKEQLIIKDPMFGNSYSFNEKGYVPEKQYINLTWIVGEKYCVVIIDGRIRHCGQNYPYMQSKNNEQTYPISFATDRGSSVSIKKLEVSRIKINKQNYIKEGDFMIKKRISNNKLKNIHNLITAHFGENYMLAGCLRYLMQSLDEKIEYDYWFFAGVLGDTFTQVFGYDYMQYNHCRSKVLFDIDTLKLAFDACGYDFSLIVDEEINNKKSYYINKVINYIDRGIPVLVKTTLRGAEYQVICGYEDYGNVLLILDGDNKEPLRYETGQYINAHWIFVGEKIVCPSIEEVYRKTILNVPNWLTMSQTNNCSFGKQAFVDWANSFQNGSFDNIAEKNLDQWRQHGTYLCICATNAYKQDFLKRAIEYCPDLNFIGNILEVYTKMQGITEELMKLEDGFGIDPIKFKNKLIMQPISKEILCLSQMCDEILSIYENK
ncbi:MerR family transcriptional regulator [Clostridiaceae bacterium M8S5]|nr:MerR family transcriptional regulator [Clostridiaceae bacterium M8S5]